MQHSFFLAVKPKAAARTNVACRGRFPTVYTAPGYRKWLDEAVPLLKELAPDFSPEERQRDVRIDTEVVVRRPKKTKKVRPRGDLDNYEKGLWDAMTKVGAWWKDDDQIVENRTTKRWTEGNEEAEGYRVRVTLLDPEE